MWQHAIIYVILYNSKFFNHKNMLQKYHTSMQSKIPHLYVKFSTNDSITSNNRNL